MSRLYIHCIVILTCLAWINVVCGYKSHGPYHSRLVDNYHPNAKQIDYDKLLELEEEKEFYDAFDEEPIAIDKIYFDNAMVKWLTEHSVDTSTLLTPMYDETLGTLDRMAITENGFKAGTKPPPVELEETYGGRFNIVQGRHRITYSLFKGLKTVDAKVKYLPKKKGQVKAAPTGPVVMDIPLKSVAYSAEMKKWLKSKGVDVSKLKDPMGSPLGTVKKDPPFQEWFMTALDKESREPPAVLVKRSGIRYNVIAGRHRICYALWKGKSKIKAKVFTEFT
eukprot:284803_1